MSRLGDWVREALAPLGVVRVRAMFGGESVSLDGLPVALIAGDKLYLKVEPGETGRFEAEGLEPFMYERDGRLVAMSYWQAPAAALVDPHVLRDWAGAALVAAKKARRTAPRRAPRTVMARGW